VGVVVIGRDEGSGLGRAIASAEGAFPAVVVYVDSGSSDGSVDEARARPGVLVHALDPGRPFTAARARNEGFAVARTRVPGITAVQFVDGDSVLRPGWIAKGLTHLDRHPDVALVAGRLREEHRARNPYHRLSDLEWDMPAGDVDSTGGNCLVRASAFAAAGGFDETLVAGEEWSLARRLRAQGHRIQLIDAEMATHDIDMTSFAQWWQRARRYGVATATTLGRHGLSDRARAFELASILFWGALLPGAALSFTLPSLGASLSLLAAYPLQYHGRQGIRAPDPRGGSPGNRRGSRCPPPKRRRCRRPATGAQARAGRRAHAPRSRSSR
jgi:GT2 family glycosyltransferase